MTRKDILETLLENTVSKIDALSESVKEIDKKLDLSVQKNDFQLEQVRNNLQENNEILAEHHRRSDELKRENDINAENLRMLIEDRHRIVSNTVAQLERRVSRTETPQKFLSQLKTVAKWVAAMSAGMAGVAAIIHYLRGI